jgi:hypothetical protein
VRKVNQMKRYITLAVPAAVVVIAIGTGAALELGNGHHAAANSAGAAATLLPPRGKTPQP